MGEWKISGRIEKIWFSFICVWLEGWKSFLFGWKEKWEDEKCNLYKLTIMSLFYNSGKVRGVGECNKVGYLCKMYLSSLFLLIFLQIWEDKKSGSGRENFPPYFFNQTVKNNIFHHIFHPPCFHPNHTQPKGIEQKYTIYLLKKKKKKKITACQFK